MKRDTWGIRLVHSFLVFFLMSSDCYEHSKMHMLVLGKVGNFEGSRSYLSEDGVSEAGLGVADQVWE